MDTPHASPSPDRTDRIVRRTAGVASSLLVAALAAMMIAVSWPRVQHVFGWSPAAPEPAYRVGQQIDVPAEWYQSSDHTVVIFARASCGACQLAQPFLQRMVLAARSQAHVVLTSGSPDREEELRYGQSIGVDAASNHVAPAGLRVRATPTLVIVDRQGRILATWEGVGPPERQRQIRQTIDGLLAH